MPIGSPSFKNCSNWLSSDKSCLAIPAYFVDDFVPGHLGPCCLCFVVTCAAIRVWRVLCCLHNWS